MHSVVMEVTRRERDAKKGKRKDECHFFLDHGRNQNTGDGDEGEHDE